MGWLEIHSELAELNDINITKLGDIRNQHRKLEVLSEHINSLVKSILEKRRQLVKNEGDLIDEDALILSFEYNLKHKKKLYKKQTQQLDQMHQNSKDLNRQIAKHFLQIIGSVI